MTALAPQIVDLMGVEGDTADYAVTYMRIAALGLPFAFLALGGQGYLRGVADLKTPLLIVIAANAVNLVLEVLFVYGFDLGDRGLGVEYCDRAGGDGGVHRRTSCSLMATRGRPAS